MLLEDSVKEFVFECEIKKYTWKTIKGYKNGLEYLVNYLKQEHNLTELEDVQTRHLKAYFMWQTKKGRKETYLNGVLKAFRSFFKYHLSEGIWQGQKRTPSREESLLGEDSNEV